jgi:hypothetical protein
MAASIHEPNIKSVDWTEHDEPSPNRGNIQRLTDKVMAEVMASVLWDERGIIIVDYLEKGQTINNEYYIAILEL